MQLRRLVQASGEVAATRSRTAKITTLAGVLAEAGPDELEIVAAYLAGAPRQDRLDVGWAALGDLDVPAAAEGTLHVADVHDRLEQLAATAGEGARQARLDVLSDLFARATASEQAFLRGLILGELRQGALEGVLIRAIAQASDVGTDAVRRAVMLSGDVAEVARVAVTEGAAAVGSYRLELFRPVQPMLATTAPSVEEAVEDLGPTVIDTKLDGARVQVHRRGGDIRVYTRNLRDVTDQVPEVVDAVRGLDLDRVVLDGEAIALSADGRPQPFQVSIARFGSSDDPDGARDAVPLSVFLFDCLHLDGRDLLDEPLERRLAALDRIVPEQLRSPRTVTDDPAEAGRFFDQVLERGHEGVVAKAASSPYEAGRRGAAWRKVKPVHTLDLVVLAAEWGSGRRRGRLSNLHLGARDAAGGGFVMLGKTFKGLTDQMLEWQTERFLELEVDRSRHVVHVRPEQVVEIAFDGVQSSSRYPGGVALRFARVKRYRDDKHANEADTIATVHAIHRGELRPDRPRPDTG